MLISPRAGLSQRCAEALQLGRITALQHLAKHAPNRVVLWAAISGPVVLFSHLFLDRAFDTLSEAESVEVAHG
jgi:hypothetical protein